MKMFLCVVVMLCLPATAGIAADSYFFMPIETRFISDTFGSIRELAIMHVDSTLTNIKTVGRRDSYIAHVLTSDTIAATLAGDTRLRVIPVAELDTELRKIFGFNLPPYLSF